MDQIKSDAIFKVLAEKHKQQVTEIQRKREDLVRIQREIKEKMGDLPKRYLHQKFIGLESSSAPPVLRSQNTRQMLVYGSPSANIIRLDEPLGGASANNGGVIDMRPQYATLEKMYVQPRPITIRMRTPPPVEIRHIDVNSGGGITRNREENIAAAERYQQRIIDYYKDYNQAVSSQLERNYAIEQERNASFAATAAGRSQDEKANGSALLELLKDQLDKSRQQSEAYFSQISNYMFELNKSLEEDRQRRRAERAEVLRKEQEKKAAKDKLVTTSTQAQPDREQTSTQVSLVDEARLRAVANRAVYAPGTGPVLPSRVVSGHAVYDMSLLGNATTGQQTQILGGSVTGQAGGPGVQVLNTGNDSDIIIAGGTVPSPDRVTLAKNNVVTHTHDNPYVQSIIAEIQQELDDIDRERRRLLIKERTKSAEQHLEKMLADLALEKERLTREVVSLARVNALLASENGRAKSSSTDQASNSAVADVLQLIKDQLRRVCKIQSEANLVRHETVMTHLKTLWGHSDAHTLVEAAPLHPQKRIPQSIVPAPIPIDPPTYDLLPAMVLFYDFVCGIPNGSLTSVVLNTSIVRRTEGRKGEEISDLLVDLGELPPAPVSDAIRLLDGVHSSGISTLPLESRGVAMIRYKHDLPQRFPADPALFAMITLGGQQANVTSRTSGFARCLVPLVRLVEGPGHPATGRFVSGFQSQSNLFSNASLYYRLVRMEDAEAELRTWPVSLARMTLYQPAFPSSEPLSIVSRNDRNDIQGEPGEFDYQNNETFQ